MTRRRLIEAAERLFVRKGFDEASVEEISETAGYSRGAFYSNFDNKGISSPCGWNSAEVHPSVRKHLAELRRRELEFRLIGRKSSRLYCQPLYTAWQV